MRAVGDWTNADRTNWDLSCSKSLDVSFQAIEIAPPLRAADLACKRAQLNRPSVGAGAFQRIYRRV